jgi:hypothetical protein
MNRRKTWVVVAGVVIVILCITSPMMLRAWQKYRGAERVFDDFADAQTKGDLQRAYSFCSPDFRAVTGYAEFVRQQTVLKSAYGSLKSISRGAVVVEGRGSPTVWTAVIKATLTFEKQRADFVYEFHERDGSWELQGSQQR